MLRGLVVPVIVKLAQQLKWGAYKNQKREVKAIHMREDFLYETQQGWIQGHKGQWLVELGEHLRCNLDNEAFLRHYRPAQRRGESK